MRREKKKKRKKNQILSDNELANISFFGFAITYYEISFERWKWKKRKTKNEKKLAHIQQKKIIIAIKKKFNSFTEWPNMTQIKINYETGVISQLKRDLSINYKFHWTCW